MQFSFLGLLLANSPSPHLAWSLPFLALIFAIAIAPQLKPHWWECHYPKVSLALGAVAAGYYLLVLRQPAPWLAAMEEYLSFIILLGALYLISGGIVIRVNQKATPLANSILLLMGAVLANIFGTTGASMMLIRPYLHMNRGHIKPFHIIFFIFIISNCGGMLTPIGDPPLFLGYLQGIPFRWTMDHLWPLWAISIGLLLIVFYVFDDRAHSKQSRQAHHASVPVVQVMGIHNLLLIALVIFAVFRPGVFTTVPPSWHVPNILPLLGTREVLMVIAALLSWKITPLPLYQHNQFSYGPIKEVAILFVGIFSTMAPALGWLENNAGKLHITTPAQFYFTTGILSAGLDNAPTYLTFLRLREAEIDPATITQVKNALAEHIAPTATPHLPISPEAQAAVNFLTANTSAVTTTGAITDEQVRMALLLGNTSLHAFILAISAGAVLFGAFTYIGNGPNFMVKSIAQSAGVPMPGFIRFVLCYSLPILLPIYLIVWLVFFI